ncbi:MAG TPA: dienelactone hydrolase family protein [Steroidobacteraceae bacterium]|jgi:dienelactone hydrolase|nr:dienelactone hydrolase family protein [Steroidobacteraceae bacterium]
MRTTRTSTAARPVRIAIGKGDLPGLLRLPAAARLVVLFAHGSGSGRLSPRNTYVAEQLGHAGLGSLLFDLLTEEEEALDARTARLRFDIPLLTARLTAATQWTLAEPSLQGCAVAYFGASTGAAAALAAAARLPAIAAVVSRGGRPDLAGSALAQVRAPTLLIVGGDDHEVLALNREALARMSCETRLEVVPGATHLFVEPGALERVASLAAAWFAVRVGAAPLDVHGGP